MRHLRFDLPLGLSLFLFFSNSFLFLDRLRWLYRDRFRSVFWLVPDVEQRFGKSLNDLLSRAFLKNLRLSRLIMWSLLLFFIVNRSYQSVGGGRFVMRVQRSPRF